MNGRTARVPAGPVGTEPVAFVPPAEQREVLLNALTAAGVEMGAYDVRIAEWLADTWSWGAVATIASWLNRASQPGRDAGLGAADRRTVEAVRVVLAEVDVAGTGRMSPLELCCVLGRLLGCLDTLLMVIDGGCGREGGQVR